MGPSLPFPLQTPENPTAPSRELWDSILDGIRMDHPGFTHVALPGVFGVHAGVKLEEQTLEHYKRIVDMADAQAMERCTQIITSFDFTEHLTHLGKEFEIPVMVLHGDADQGMPYDASTKLIETLIPRTEAKIYKTAGHGKLTPPSHRRVRVLIVETGLYLTHAQQVINDLLAFARQEKGKEEL
jgi:non-heme chloroperoxidase